MDLEWAAFLCGVSVVGGALGGLAAYRTLVKHWPWQRSYLLTSDRDGQISWREQ